MNRGARLQSCDGSLFLCGLRDEIRTGASVMTTSDIVSLDYAQLNDLRTRIDERMKEMRETGVPELRVRFSEAAAALGLSIDDIVGVPKKRKRRSRNHGDADAD